LAIKADLPPLTGLRFVAAFCILYMHTTVWCLPFNDSGFLYAIASAVSIYGMPLFFVLSGFVIHYNYGSLFRDQAYAAAVRDFLSARFARVYPLFIFFCIFGALTDFTANWIRYEPRYFLSYIVHSVTLTQSWVYKIVVNERLLLANGFGLAWSLSCEFFFYLAYAFFVFAILLLRRPTRTIVVMLVFSGVVFGVLTFAQLHIDAVFDFARAHVNHFIAAEENADNSFYRWLFYYSPYVRIWEFVLGCLTAQLFLLMQGRAVSKAEKTWAGAALGLALLVLLACGIVQGGHFLRGFAHGLFHMLVGNFGLAVPIAIVIFCAARYRTPLAAFLSLPWIVWLGDISYSIYAVHTWTVRPFIRPAVDFDLVFGIDAILRIVMAIAFTIIVAAATFTIIEVPCRRYLRAKLMRPHGADPAGFEAGEHAVACVDPAKNASPRLAEPASPRSGLRRGVRQSEPQG
jgi:peptidoglycan/LPS O-acetylase OafA/YrhL